MRLFSKENFSTVPFGTPSWRCEAEWQGEERGAQEGLHRQEARAGSERWIFRIQLRPDVLA